MFAGKANNYTPAHKIPRMEGMANGVVRIMHIHGIKASPYPSPYCTVESVETRVVLQFWFGLFPEKKLHKFCLSSHARTHQRRDTILILPVDVHITLHIQKDVSEPFEQPAGNVEARMQTLHLQLLKLQ